MEETSRGSPAAWASSPACSNRTRAADTSPRTSLSEPRFSTAIASRRRSRSSRESSVCDPRGEAWSTRNLYVVDGAVLPTALGVNPMITIEAAAHKIARGMAAKLT